MVDIHSQVFFGQTTGIIVKSPSKEEPYIFVQCIRKKPDGVWEKPTNGEGKSVRLSLEEIIMVLGVLNRKVEKWTTVHEYQGAKSPIAFSWEDSSKNKLWINIGDYSKMLTYSQIELFRMLLEHILEEKIRYATTGSTGKKTKNIPDQSVPVQEPPPFKMPEVEKIPSPKQTPTIKKSPVNSSKTKDASKEQTQVKGNIQGETEKAVLINIAGGQELWFPKSTIHSQFNPDKGFDQNFLIDDWILKKNKVIT